MKLRRFLLATSALALLVCVVLFVRAIPAAEPAQNPFRGRRLYVDPNSPARKQMLAWQRSRPDDARLMAMIAQQPQAMWLGGWARDMRRETDMRVTNATRAGALPVLVAYNIPYRDCGSYSAGGANGGDAYRRWILDMARGINSRPAVVILEPDAISNADCLPLRLKDERFILLQDAVRTLGAAGAYVYIDAGHVAWRPAPDIAARLKKAGIDRGTGFALNVSNYHSTAKNVAYGNRVSALVGNKHYVIDTSRNGAATNGTQWCNVRNQALGQPPTTDTRLPLVDAFLWIKTPGESDGTCNGGPPSGKWWADYALELSKMADVLKTAMPR